MSLQNYGRTNNGFSISIPDSTLNLVFLIAYITYFFSPLQHDICAIYHIIHLRIRKYPIKNFGQIHSFSRKRDLPLNVKIFRIIKEIVPRFFFDFLECFFNSHILKTEFHSRILRMNGLSIRNPNGHEHKHNKEPHKQRDFTNCP